MPSEYKPHDNYDAPFDPTRCKASVHGPYRSLRFTQCQRKPQRDGWCWQHHPDAERARQEAQAERDRRQIERRQAPYRKIERLERQVAHLLAACEALVAYVESIMQHGNPCPLCTHHYIHTDADNIGKLDREYEHTVCPYPIARAAIAKAKGDDNG